MPEIFAVKQMLVRPFPALFVEPAIGLRARRLTQGLRHFRRAIQCQKVKSLQPRIRAELLDIQRIVLTPLENAVKIRIPRVRIVF